MSKVYLDIDTYFLSTVARLANLPEKEVLFIFSDKAAILADKLMSAQFKSNWSSTTFNIDGLPMKIKLKAKYTGYQGRKLAMLGAPLMSARGAMLSTTYKSF